MCEEVDSPEPSFRFAVRTCVGYYPTMASKTRTTAPIVAVILLMLPMLYVGSYLSLVEPRGTLVPVTGSLGEEGFLVYDYRYGRGYTSCAFWPLEQIDRKLRPAAWNPPSPWDEPEMGSGFLPVSPP